MKNILLISANFLGQAFRKWWAWPVYFLLPVASFCLFVTITRLGGAPPAEQQGLSFHLFFIFIQAGIISGLTIKDKEQGISLRIRIAPVRDIEYALGNMLASFAVLGTQILITLGIVSFVLPFVDPSLFPGLLCIYLVSGFSAVGLGVFLSVFAEDSTQGAFVYNFVIYPTSILGGCFFPLKFMSSSMRKISWLFPQSWAVRAIDSLRSGDIETMAVRLVLTALFGVFFLMLFAYVRQRKENPI